MLHSIRNPVGSDVDKVLELLDTPADVLRMRCASEVELQIALANFGQSFQTTH